MSGWRFSRTFGRYAGGLAVARSIEVAMLTGDQSYRLERAELVAGGSRYGGLSVEEIRGHLDGRVVPAWKITVAYASDAFGGAHIRADITRWVTRVWIDANSLTSVDGAKAALIRAIAMPARARHALMRALVVSVALCTIVGTVWLFVTEA